MEGGVDSGEGEIESVVGTEGKVKVVAVDNKHEMKFKHLAIIMGVCIDNLATEGDAHYRF